MIEATTKLDKSEIGHLNNFHLFRKNRLIVILPSFLFATLGTVILFLSESAGDTAGGISLLIFGVCFPLLLYLALKIAVWYQLKSTKFISDDSMNYFKITNESLYNKLERKDCTSSFEAKWSLVYKAYETKTHFFIYISNMQAFIISKSGIYQGSVEELRTMISESIGSKFKRMT